MNRVRRHYMATETDGNVNIVNEQCIVKLVKVTSVRAAWVLTKTKSRSASIVAIHPSRQSQWKTSTN